MNILLRRRKLGNGSCNGIKAASTTGIDVVRNDGTIPAADFVFRWGCTSSIPNPQGNTVVLNTAAAIHWCSNKRQGRLDMQAGGVSVPKTYDHDPHWFDGNEFLEMTPAELAVKYVARQVTHAQGRNLFVGNFNDCQATILRWGTGGYISELIDKVAEYRVMVVQNRVVWVAKKTPGNPEDVAWNVARGGRFDNVRWGDWPMAVVVQALKAANVSKTDFCGVDVMVDAAGAAFVLEVNSAPSQTSPYRQQCVAKAFDHIVTNGKDHFPDVKYGSWKAAIHPALLKDG